MLKPFCVAAVALAALFTSPALAQTGKGTTILGLSFGRIDFQKKPSYSAVQALLMPSVGKFVSDRVALGATVPIGYGRSSSRYYGGTSRSRTLELGLVPWLRYYLPTTSKHQFFGELGAGAALNSYRSNGNDSRNNVYLLANLGVGYTYFVAPAVGLEAVLAYDVNGGTSEAFGSTALSLRLGIRAYLPKGGAASAPTE